MSDRELSRRDVLRASAYGAAGVTIGMTASALGQTAPAGEKIRLGVIGTGNRFGNGHLPALKQLAGDIDVVAACDVSEERLAKAINRLGKSPQPYADYQKLLA